MGLDWSQPVVAADNWVDPRLEPVTEPALLCRAAPYVRLMHPHADGAMIALLRKIADRLTTRQVPVAIRWPPSRPLPALTHDEWAEAAWEDAAGVYLTRARLRRLAGTTRTFVEVESAMLLDDDVERLRGDLVVRRARFYEV